MPYPMIFSIGHSNHDIETFIDLLRQHGIECLIDVRSAPYSRFSPHFSRRSLEAHLRDEGIEYVYLGQALGGRPEDDSCYDAAGNVDYQRISGKTWYREGIDSLIATANECRVAMMCSEENPEQCHRQMLITDTLLRESRADVQHVRGDGRLEAGRLSPIQTRLF
jgi:uncharacterized protein (DUF488 family)